MTEIKTETRPTPNQLLNWAQVSALIGGSVAAISAYILYYGHTFVISYLVSFGYESPIVSSSNYNLVSYFIAGNTDGLIKLANYRVFYAFGTVFLIFSALYAAAHTTLFLTKKLNANKSNSPKISQPSKSQSQRKDEKTKNSSSTLDGFFQQLFIKLATIFLIFSFLLIFIIGLWILSFQGYKAGKKLADKQINEFINRSNSQESESSKEIHYCSVITTKSGQRLYGIRIYHTEDSTFFFTREGSYELDNSLTIKYFNPTVQKNLNLQKDKKHICEKHQAESDKTKEE